MNDHAIRIILSFTLILEDKNNYILWSLRFDGRRVRDVFCHSIFCLLVVAILETRIPGFYAIHIPKSMYALSAYEHTLISNLSREFLPPATAIFRELNGFPAGVYVPNCEYGKSF